jgi:amino acid adenylation domain-containing protein
VDGEIALQEGESAFPLSFAQRRLWFLCQLDAQNTMYSLPLVAPFDAAVIPALLERSINEIVRRHETLRTVFAEIDDEPMQIIRPALQIPLAVADLRSLPAEQRDAETTRFTVELARRPFDLLRGPLLRTALLQLGPDRSVFVLVVHHIVADGWSLGIFWRELIEIYNALYMRRAPALPELPIQYADFAVWQRERLEGEKLAALLDFWRTALDRLSTLQFPTDRPRPPLLSYNGATHPVKLTRRLTAALRQLSQAEGATLFMTMFAAFAALLQRYTGQEDIVVGMPAASRDHEELEGLIGFFVNSLVLRADLSGDPTFRALLARVRHAALEAFAHQELPFEKLVEELRPERDLSRNPLFQVSFQVIAFGAAQESDEREGSATPPINRGSAIFDLAVNLWESGDEVEGQIEYSTDLFDAATIERFAASFQALLRSVVADADKPLSALQALSAAEQRLLLETWNDNRLAVPDLPVHRLFEAQAKRQPDRPAVSSRERALSYAELDREADALAARLRGLGVGRDSLVAICMERGVDLVVAMLGVLKSGGAFLPMDAAYPPERLAFMLADSGAKVILSHAAAADRLPPATAPVLLLEEVSGAKVKARAKASATGPEDLCYVVYTSGSTGEPKGVAVPHRALMNLVAWHIDAFSVGPADRASQIASAGFDACVWEVWPYLAAGASVHILSDAVRGVPRDLVKALADQRITMAFVPTPLAQMLFEEPAFPGLGLRHLLTGGDKLTRPPPPDLPFQVVNNYGPSEYCVVSTSCALGGQDGAIPPIGRPIANTRVYVLDRRGNPVPIGATGELHVGGPGLALGYLNRAELSAERFVPNPFSPSESERLYKTGDLVRYRADGMLEFLGRTDSQIKLRGFRIEVGEIEAVLARNPRLRQSVVSVVADERGDQLAAFVVPRTRAGDATAAGELAAQVRADLAARLPEHMVPASIVVVAELPQIANGKIDRHALALTQAGQAGHAPRESRAPRTALEEVLVIIWCDILGIESAGVDDNFFELGGHSLLAARLISRVRDWLKVEAPLQALFRAPTPAQFAERLLGEAARRAEVEKAARLILDLAGMPETAAKALLAGAAPAGASEGR